MKNTAGIAGGGLMGRVLGWHLARRGWQVALFEKDGKDVPNSAGYASAGMVAPSCEMESAEESVARLGHLALGHWQQISETLEQPIHFHKRGSLVVAHPRDRAELDRLKSKITPGLYRAVNREEMLDLEPELSRGFEDGLYVPEEAHLDARAALAAFAHELDQLGAEWHTDTEVIDVSPRTIVTCEASHAFDWAIDCRGLGARLDGLRGVRGEVLRVHAPDVSLSRPVRLMHPRYPIYIVPYPNGEYVVGATAIESDDMSPISVRSALELLSALYSVHTGFAEARLVETCVNCRPAFSDNRPRVLAGDGMLCINGLYRHGWLTAPAIADFVLSYLETGKVAPDAEPFFTKGASHACCD